jgi:site-specific recombinase XerD
MAEIGKELGQMRAFPVRMPSGARYWTVVNDELRTVPVADAYLRHVRFGRDDAESTTKSYAGAVVLYLLWCGLTGLDWRTAADRMGSFVLWLRHNPTRGRDGEVSVVVAGPGARDVRGPRRINAVLAAVRGFLAFAVDAGEAPARVLGQLYELADSRSLPAEARGEDGAWRLRMRARHRVRVPTGRVERASDEHAVALLRACRSARDRLLVLLLCRAGLRRSEAVGLRREDIHFLVDASALGCEFPGSHLHIVRRDNVNGAWAKSRHSRAVPVDRLVGQAHDQYVLERAGVPAAAGSDFVFVNLLRPPVGAPMKPDAVNGLFVALSRRAGLGVSVRPHTLRHAFASNVLDAGGALDEVQELLGHASVSSTQVYVHPDHGRLRAAVERVGSARLSAAGEEAR